MNSKPTQLIDMVGKTIEILGRTFTVDWIDAPRQPDNGKIMVQSADTEIYHIGDKDEPLAEVESEIRDELMRATCVITFDEQITRYARRIAAQVCGGFADNNTVGGIVDALIIQEAVRRRLTDNDMKEDGVFSATVENREKLRRERSQCRCTWKEGGVE